MVDLYCYVKTCFCDDLKHRNLFINIRKREKKEEEKNGKEKDLDDLHLCTVTTML
jgi:hypothetical protein